MRRAYLLILLFVLPLATGCGTGAVTGASTVPTLEPYPTLTPRPTATPLGSQALEPESCQMGAILSLGAIESFSGSGAPYGRSIRQGIELAVTEINRSKFIGPFATLQVSFKDDGSTGERAAQALRTLIRQERIIGILGPSLSDLAFDVAPIAQEAGIPIITTASGADEVTAIGDFVFHSALPGDAVAPNTINAARRALGAERVVLLYESADDERIPLQEAALAQGLTFVAEIPLTTDDGAAALLERAVAADPDLIVVSAGLARTVDLLRVAGEQGLRVPIVGNESFNHREALRAAARGRTRAIVGAAWFVGSPVPANEHFVRAFDARHGSAPDQFAAQAYTSVWLFAHAIRNACSDNPARIRDALAELRLVETPLGAFSFDTDRGPLHAPVVLTVRGGEPVLFELGN